MSAPPCFEIYRDAAGTFRWRLTAGSDELACGIDAFYNDWNAHRSARAFKLAAARAGYRCFEVAGRWTWEALREDGRLLATSSVSFPTGRAAQQAADRARRLAVSAIGP